MAVLIALTVLAVVNRFDVCRALHYKANCLTYDTLSIISVGNIESFSIVTVALLYILERREHKQEKHKQALEAIITSAQLGLVNSLARLDALEDLNEDGLWLDNMNLQGADLEGLEVPYSRFRGANLSGTILKGANLQGADLTGANLTGADLTDANLAEADLTDAILTDTILTGTNLTGAILPFKAEIANSDNLFNQN
ncbi:MAG: hypothetical protein N5P05_003475 [Chroococcopsis gigantea SAG 12.99]|jgi:uncharacterized protein YjbI with pentapeptide repeats|nr:hypothetical protein [Chroococcopsis gigantea SAG 12.99]